MIYKGKIPLGPKVPLKVGDRVIRLTDDTYLVDKGTMGTVKKVGLDMAEVEWDGLGFVIFSRISRLGKLVLKRRPAIKYRRAWPSYANPNGG